MATLLIVDDSREVLTVLKRQLEAEGYTVLVADNASEAVMLVEESRPDLILTDIDMPGLDGHAFCRILKRKPATASIPVLMMSGVDVRERDALDGYESGALDYLLKPIPPKILSAKVKAVLGAGAKGFKADDRLRLAGLAVSPSTRAAKLDGKALELTPREFDLLVALLQSGGRVLSVNYLLSTVWRVDPAEKNDPRSVEVHVSRLRKKLGPKFAKRIVNVIGHGYKLES